MFAYSSYPLHEIGPHQVNKIIFYYNMGLSGDNETENTTQLRNPTSSRRSNQFAISLAWPRIRPLDYSKQIQLAVRAGLEL